MRQQVEFIEEGFYYLEAVLGIVSNHNNLKITNITRRRLVIGLSFVIAMAVLFYFSGIFNLPAATVLGPGRHIESKSGFVVGNLSVHPVVNL